MMLKLFLLAKGYNVIVPVQIGHSCFYNPPRTLVRTSMANYVLTQQCTIKIVRCMIAMWFL